MLRVVIVDDHPVARHGLQSMLAGAYDVVATAERPGDLPLDETGRVAADLVILDLYLESEKPALEVIADLSAQRPVLIVSASREPADVLAAMQSGASGYETKHATAEAYAEAIETVAGGDFYLSSQLADLIQAALDGLQPASARVELSTREREVLSFVARGFTHHQIANRLTVSKSTVDTYIGRIRAKLGLGNKAELAIAALRYLDRPG